MASVSKSQPEPAIMLRSQGCRSSGFSQPLILLFHCNNISNIRAKPRGARHPGSSFVSQLTNTLYVTCLCYCQNITHRQQTLTQSQCNNRWAVKGGLRFTNRERWYWINTSSQRQVQTLSCYTKNERPGKESEMLIQKSHHLRRIQYITIYYPLSNVSIILLLSFTVYILNLILHSELMASLLTPSIRTFNSKLDVLYPRFLSQMTLPNHTQEIWTHECQVTNCTKQENRKRGVSYLWLW